jgi:hypothetical protein
MPPSSAEAQLAGSEAEPGISPRRGPGPLLSDAARYAAGAHRLLVLAIQCVESAEEGFADVKPLIDASDHMPVDWPALIAEIDVSARNLQQAADAYGHLQVRRSA